MINRDGVDVASRSGLSAVLIVIVAVTLWGLFRHDMPQANRDAIMLVIGALLIRLSDVYSYYFGSSVASTRKDSIIASQAETAKVAGVALAQAAAGSDPAAIVLKPGGQATATATEEGTVITPSDPTP